MDDFTLRVIVSLAFLAIILVHGLVPHAASRRHAVRRVAECSRGPHAWIDHPVYMGELLLALGGLLVTGHLLGLAFLLLLWGNLIARAALEERLLARRLDGRPSPPTVRLVALRPSRPRFDTAPTRRRVPGGAAMALKIGAAG